MSEGVKWDLSQWDGITKQKLGWEWGWDWDLGFEIWDLGFGQNIGQETGSGQNLGLKMVYIPFRTFI